MKHTVVSVSSNTLDIFIIVHLYNSSRLIMACIWRPEKYQDMSYQNLRQNSFIILVVLASVDITIYYQEGTPSFAFHTFTLNRDI